MSESTFKEDIKINKFGLDNCCEEQASFMHYWGDMEADAKKDKSKAIQKVKELRAEKQLYYFLHPKDNIKNTVDNVKAMVEADEEVRKAEQEVIELTHKADRMAGNVRALEHRKSELKNLTNQWIAGYYATPTGSKSKTDDKIKEQRNLLNEKKEEGIENE
jgi:hypothetical protein